MCHFVSNHSYVLPFVQLANNFFFMCASLDHASGVLVVSWTLMAERSVSLLTFVDVLSGKEVHAPIYSPVVPIKSVAWA